MGRTVEVIGAPTDYGADRRGVDMGPSAIRYAGLAPAIEATGATCIDSGDMSVPAVEGRSGDDSDVCGPAKYLDEVEDVSVRLARKVAGAIDEGRLPLVLGGDHSIAIGTLGGASRDAEIGVVWFDAHGDFNTPESSPSGNVHGMPLAAVLGRGAFAELEWAHSPGVSEENVAWVGLRDLDERERELIEESDATAYTMSEIDERGISAVVDDALDDAAASVDAIHVSLDLDWLDPDEAPGVGTPVRGGVTYREAHSALEAVAETDARHDLLRSVEVVEVNPILDTHNRTAELAVELAASALGKRIL